MSTRVLCVLVVVLALGFVSATNCVDGVWPLGDDESEAAIAVAAGADANGEATAVEFNLYACGADEPEETAKVPFQVGSVGNFPAFYQYPLQVDPTYAFSEQHFAVEPGCYRVEAQPVDTSGQAIDACRTMRTPDTFIERGQSQKYAVVSPCETAVTGALEVDDERNYPPKLADLTVERKEGGTCSEVEVCAIARDRDGDSLRMQWEATARSGERVDLPRPERTGSHGRLTECIELGPGEREWDITVTVRDQTERERGGAISREDAYLGRHGLVAQSRDSKAVRLETECEAASCPDDPSERITDVTYWITRDGQLLAPTDDLRDARSGDMVDVEFEVAPGCVETEVTFASYTTTNVDEKRREKVASIFRRSYAPGHHLLWNVLPECEYVVDLHLGPPLGDSERPAGGNPYGDRLIDTFAGGGESCEKRARQ